MDTGGPTQKELRTIDALVAQFERDDVRGLVARFCKTVHLNLLESRTLAPHIHSIKWRIKDSGRLKDKLVRKLMVAKSAKKKFDITRDNLLVRINDLAGIRILHLHTRQLEQIDNALREIFAELQYRIIEGPFARTWDDESRNYFRSIGVETEESPSLYTSVHYVIGSASRTPVTCEIQVRTLMEEVWGEVDHRINYPRRTDSLACREQILVLARVTSSATRLVDAIFLTHADHKGRSVPRARSK